MQWTTACPDWWRLLAAGESIIPEPLFPDEAEASLEVFKGLKIVDAPGSPTIEASCAPWVLAFAGAVFGSYNSETGERLIREVMLCIPKKNSKSTIAAGIMLTALIRNWRLSAEFIILAPTKEIADNSFIPAKDMVNNDEELKALLHVQPHLRLITHRETGATLKVVAADSDVVGGKKAVGVLIDEAWLFGKNPKAADMIREATGGLLSRPEGFIIWLTTQSNEPPAGVFRSKLNYARGVRDGRIDDNRFLPIIYEFSQEMIKSGEARKPENFHLVNPNINYSVDRPTLERLHMQAEIDGEAEMRGFLAKHLNIEIGLALMSDSWVGAAFWEPQAKEGMTLDDLLEQCEVIDVGVDGGGLDDLLGLAVIGRIRESRTWLHWAHAWAHPSVLERRKSEAPRLRDLEATGDLTIVDKIGDDVDQLAAIVSRINQAGLLDKVGLDPAGIGAVLDALADVEIDEDQVVGISQGWKLTGAIKTTERRLAEGSFIHSGQPLMAWSCGNAKGVPSANAFLITKQASGTAKIDPLMATFNAVSLMALNPEARGGLDDYLNHGFFGLVG
ncbi:Phage terminase-like protein, large subunit [Pseudomonas putida]|uniref:terminase large subunit n=1 Tax=Pseudomonas asiatica TaxID=2219225 RepID=UPI0010C0C05D|nr:terminase large subunit [Pseudomonas asiatica]CAB5637291.1 Phage terminase-like protein, large subunit [Pseudomonas putida]MBO2923271.1 terminase large subunit [Pseudomonas asiatica]WPU60221.1 terminase large subunit [Pseudomonas asiatica]CAB5683997.1 Phage terminase-like protein, large subunit [Pseudomonas putida]CAB5712880.1 Phage terminase-like protein, large subunit [Pseudomonas putida]